MQTTCRKYRRCSSVAFQWALIVILLPFFSFSQVINTIPAEIAFPEPVFTKEYIKQNKIKLIRKSIVDKPDGEIIRDKGLAENFQYDENGNLVRHYYNEINSMVKTETEMPTVIKKGKVVKKSYTKVDFQYRYDTLSTEYSYTSNGFLIMQRKGMGNFYHTTYYEYTGSGWLSRRTLCRETNKALHGEPFKLGVQVVLSDERFEYEELTPTQVKKIFLNDEGKPYKQGILNYSAPVNSGGKITDESYQFVVGFIRTSSFYKYDENGRLAERVYRDNSSGDHTEKITYEYDGVGNLIKEKRFKNGMQTNETIFLYENKKLLTSQADRQIQKESIKIVKYEYEFYP